jgi:hypothetical protein
VSYKATNWAYELELTGSKKSVLVALADMADEAGTCFPGHDRIASMTGRSNSTVERALKALESVGVIERVKRHDARGWRTSDRYQLNLTVKTPTRQNAESADCELGILDRLPVSLTPPTRQGDDAEPSDEPSEEPSVNKPASKPARGSRLSPDWWPSDALFSWASQEIPNVDVLGETPNFVDWWVAAAGAKAVKVDWDRTWKVWMRRQRPSNAPRPTPFDAAAQLVQMYQQKELDENR